MLRRVNPIALLGLIIALILSLGILAVAQGGSASDALAAAEGQVGKPFMMSTDGPDTFSCVGLMRYALRTAGVDPDAPWVPEEYLSRYPGVAPGDLQPGDIVIYPNWATMYAGNGMLVNANEMEGVVTHTPMDVAGTPLGIVRPYGGGSSQPAATEPAAVDPGVAPDPVATDLIVTDPLATDPSVPVATDPVAVDPMTTQPMATEPLATEPVATEPMATEPMATDPTIAEPAVIDPAAQQF